MERKLAIVTDSSCDIPKELAEKYHIDIVDFPINLDGKEYFERRDLTYEQFYEMMRAAQGVPTTAAITQMQWLEVYEKYADEGYTDVLHVSINSTGSATYNYAKQAAAELAEERPGHKLKIHLIDSHTYSMVYGWYVCEAARKIRNGAEVAPIAAWLDSVFARAEAVLAAYSLKVMKKSGRVSAAAAFAGELLGLRPVISLTDGVSQVQAKVRGDAAVPPAMIKFVKTRVEDLRQTPYMVAYTSSTAKRDELVKLCKKEFGHAPMTVFQLGGVVSANTGPDAVALIFEGNPRRFAD